MKLFKLRLTTLKSKLYAIILTSVISRVLIQLFLPYEPTNLAPDEGNYAHLANWISLEKPADLYPNYGNLYRTTRAFILPAAFLDKAGIPQLLSVRLISGLYSILTTILVAKLITESKHLDESHKSYSRIAVAIFFIFTFWPSRFIWSIFGMRESAVEFWVILTYFVFTLIFQSDNRRKFPLVIMLSACILMVYFSRPQVGLVMSFSLIIAAAMHLKLVITKIVIPVIILTAIMGDTATSLEEKAIPLTNETNSNSGTENALELSQVITNGLKKQADSVLIHQKNNKLTAASAIPEPFCPIEEESTKNRKYICLLWTVPSTTFTFIFRPLAPSDMTSITSLLAIVENLFLLIIFIYIFIRIFLIRRLNYFQKLSPLLIFMTTYCVSAGVYEGNMGTGFRHKSLIFWIVFLVLSSAIFTNKKNRT